MVFCEWDDSYSVEVPEADQQHRWLFALINELHEATTNTGREATIDSTVDEMGTIAAVLDELMRYTVHHFSTEESYMLACAYPERAVHQAAHQHFVERVRSFKRDFDNGEAVCSVAIIHFLRDWLDNHIRTLDKQLGVFLSAQHAAQSRAPARATPRADPRSHPATAAPDCRPH
jgi:hemerythrin